MQTGTFVGAFARQFFLLLFVVVTLLSARAEAQAQNDLFFDASAGGPTTVKIEVRGGYSWAVEELNGSVWKIVLVGGAGTHTHNLTRPPGTHKFRLQNCFPGYGCSTSSTKSVWLKGVVPSTPASITVTPNVYNNSFTISWPSSSGAATYNVLRSGSPIHSGTALSHTFTGATANVAYAFSVQACNSTGSCSLPREAPSRTITIPSVPGSISVAPSSNNNTFGVNWAASTGTLTHYALTQTGVTGAFTVNGTSTTRSGTPGVATTFAVRACNGMNCSNLRTATPSTIPIPSGPAAPVVSGNVTSSSITISWTAPTGATSYQLKRGTATLTPNGRTYVDRDVVPGNSYTYSVTACNATGQCSAPATKVVTYPPRPAIPQFSSIAMDGTAVLVKWNAVPNATTYRLTRGTTRNLTALQYRDTSVTAGTTYTYTLRACNAAQVCSNTRSQQFTVPLSVPVPAAPTVTAHFSGASIAVSWSQSAHASSYQLQRNGQTISNVGNPYIDRAIEANNTFTYTVRACNSNGQCSAARSASAVVPAGPLFEVQTTGPNTFTIYAGNVYSASIQEKVNGVWKQFQLLPPGVAIKAYNYTKPSGLYTFRLDNCYNSGSGCSTSAGQNVLLVGSSPPEPNMTAAILDGVDVLLEWNRPAGAVNYTLRRADLSSPLTTGNYPATSYIDDSVTSGATYTYNLMVCNNEGDCSTGSAGPITVPRGSSSSSVSSSSSSLSSTSSSKSSSSTSSISSSSSVTSSSAVSSQSSSSVGIDSVVVKYTYDALGRLTFIEDSQNGNRDYDYDPAGNRLVVAVGGSDDAAVVPQPPGVTMSLSSGYISNCAWRADWAVTLGATHYYFKSTQSDPIRLTANTITFSCPDNNPNANRPVWVESCNSVGCGPRANF